MKNNQLKIKMFLIISIAAMLACSAPLLIAPVDNPSATNTSVAATVEARLTEVWAEATATSHAAPATNTPEPTDTPTPTETQSPTATPSPTPTATSKPVACNAASFVRDMTVADQTYLPKGAEFVKQWRLKNVGSCTWTKDYEITFDGGDKLGGSTVSMPKNVSPGEVVDISIAMKAPKGEGSYKGFWILRNENGTKFGVGAGADKPIWVQIRVSDAVAKTPYDFTETFCDATWKTDTHTFPCQGTSQGYSNYVIYTTSFVMESDRIEDEPALIVNIEQDQRVRGIYSSYLVQSGDRFIAEVGCVEGNSKCKVQIRLRYQIKGTDNSGILSEWLETYDGNTTMLDIDLDSLAGEEVIFILDMEAKSNSDRNEVFWFLPQIKNP
jgi:hypothetical protein